MLQLKYLQDSLVSLPNYTVVILMTVSVRPHSPANIKTPSSLWSNHSVPPSNSSVSFPTLLSPFSVFRSTYTTPPSSPPSTTNIPSQTLSLTSPNLTTSQTLHSKFLSRRRHCSDNHDCETQPQLMAHHTILHGYLRITIHTAFARAGSVDRAPSSLFAPILPLLVSRFPSSTTLPPTPPTFYSLSLPATPFFALLVIHYNTCLRTDCHCIGAIRAPAFVMNRN